MLVKFLNSDSTVSTAIAGSYFKGDGWTGAYYDSGTGQLVFESEDGLGFTTEDLRVAAGGTSTVEWTEVLNKPASFPPSAHTHLWANISDKPTEFTPVSHNHTISQVTDLQNVIDAKADKSQILTQQQFKDSVAAMFQSGTHTNVSINYDSVAGTINLSAAGGGGASVDEEEVQDWVGNLITQGTGISVIYDDVGNVLSIGLSGVSFTNADKAKLDGIAENATANSTDSQLRDRSTHTGTQDISTINGLQTELDGKQPTTSFKTINGTAITGLGDIVLPAGAAQGYRIIVRPGYYVTQLDPTQTLSTTTAVADRLRMAAFSFDRDITVSSIGISVSTAAAGLARAYVYERTGIDEITLVHGSGDLDTGSTGGKSEAWSFTFEAGKVYLAGVITNATPGLRTVPVQSSLLSFGHSSMTQSAQTGAFQISMTYGSSPPTKSQMLSISTNSAAPAVFFEMAESAP